MTDHPVGWIVDVLEDTDPYSSNTYGGRTSGQQVKRKIWDGDKFVNLDSKEGADVMNKVLQGLGGT